MSTSAVVPSNETVAALPIKKENVNFAVVAKLDADGKIVSVRHTSSEKDINKLKSLSEDGKTAVPYTGNEYIAFEQTVVKPSAGTLAGFEELITDPEERLNVINKGLASKFNQKIRTTLIEQDETGAFTFQPVDGLFDATSLVQEATMRVTLSPEDKVRRMITASGLSAEALAAIVASIQNAAAAK